MYKFKSRYFMFAAILACLLSVQVASAQNPANITALSGNGQIFCSCPLASGVDPLTGAYYPLVVRVTDGSNRPLAGVGVSWNLVSGYGQFFGNTTTTTAQDGTTSIAFFPGGGTQPPSAPPILNQVTATAGAVAVTFDLTQAFDASGLGGGDVAINASSLPQTLNNGPITANSGQQGFTYGGTSGNALSLGVITSGGTPIPGVSVRIVNFPNQPTNASCITGPGADPGSVLTDSTGFAVCTPVFTGSGSGTFYLVIGGAPLCNCSQDPSPLPTLTDGNLLNYYLKQPTLIQMTVANATVTSVTVVSGNGQSATAGQQVTGALVAAVNASTGGTLSSQSVVWSVSPAGAGTLTNTSATSDANGQVSNVLILSNSASGTVTVTATLASNSSLKATFTITAIPLITLGGLSKISGDGQTAIVNTPFANPLVVQVTSNAGTPVPNIPVSFSAAGGALLSATQASTGTNGQAQVTITAPGTAGSITVTASASGVPSVTFNLTVSPPGPVLTASNFVNAADQKVGSLSPCSLATIISNGIASGVQGVAGNVFGLGGFSPTLGNETVTVGNNVAPILNVGSVNGLQQLTFQVPCNASTGSTQVTVALGGGSGSATVNILPASPGVFQTSTVLALSGITYPLSVFVRPDGSFVTQANPARKGDTIVAYVTGLGPATPAVSVTNDLPLPTAISTANNTIVVGIANAGVPLISAQLSPDLVGVYLVTFQVPSSAPSGNQVFSVGVSTGGQTYYSLGSAIPIQ